MTTPSRRSEILQKAHELTIATRNEVYGDPYTNLNHTAQMWSAYLGVPVTAEDVAHCMQLLKMSRAKGGRFHPDNYDDNVAYGAIAGECAYRERTKHGTVSPNDKHQGAAGPVEAGEPQPVRIATGVSFGDI